MPLGFYVANFFACDSSGSHNPSMVKELVKTH